MSEWRDGQHAYSLARALLIPGAGHARCVHGRDLDILALRGRRGCTNAKRETKHTDHQRGKQHRSADPRKDEQPDEPEYAQHDYANQVIHGPSSSLSGTITNALVENLPDGVWLGAPLHPALTDIPVGSWLLSRSTPAYPRPRCLRAPAFSGANTRGRIEVGLPNVTGAVLPELANLQPDRFQPRNSRQISSRAKSGRALD